MLQETTDNQDTKLEIDHATQKGLIELLEKAAPLLQGKRFHNIIDLLSAVSDTIDMADDAMIQKVVKTADEAIGGAWTAGNAARYAAAQVSREPVPSTFQLLRKTGDEDFRRGLHFTMKFLSILGKQMHNDDELDGNNNE